MKKYISIFLITGMILFMGKESFSQAEEQGDNSSKLFNEGGYVRGMTLPRILGLAELALGVASIIIAIRAKKRLSKRGAKVALTLAFGAVVFSAVHFFVTAGAVFGSGSGKAGAIIAFILGLIGSIIAYRIPRSLKSI